MTMRLADRLNAARKHQFVGRTTERGLFVDAVAAPELPFCLLYIFGPGGVGKTTLLREYGALCQQRDIPATYLDGRSIDPAPDAFLYALCTAIGLDVDREPAIELIAAQHKRRVLLIDTFETLTPLDSWLRDVLLPRLSDQVLIVLAGRDPPAIAWRADAGWQTLIRTVPLRNLQPEEGRSYLHRRDVPSDQHEDVLNFTHGHPLALSLVADLFAQREDVRFRPDAAPDIIRTLLEQLVQKVPGPAHRVALEACALVRLMTEPLLAEMLGVADAHEMFEWLRGLSFMDSGRHGVFPHDLAREALSADVRWRNHDWYAELHKRARTYYARALLQSHGRAQQRILFDYVFLHRESPILRPFFEWQESGTLVADTASRAEWPELIEMIRQHEGEQSAHHAAYWFEHQPQNVIVFRDAAQRPAGLLMRVEFHEATQQEVTTDPATHAAWEYLEHHAPLRPGERAAIFRFWLAADTYQGVSAIQSRVFVNCAQYYLTTPGLAFTMFPCADADFWEPALTYVDLHRTPQADFVVGGHSYGMYVHDWRIVPPLAWLAVLADREIDTTPVVQRAPSGAAMVVLSRPAFETALRDALHLLNRPDGLLNNPLLRSRFVIDRAGSQANEHARVAVLQTVIRETTEVLQATPRDVKSYRAIYHTYLNPGPTQEQVAELLDIPFSTFRRHLKTGIARLADLLWQRELQGSGS